MNDIRKSLSRAKFKLAYYVKFFCNRYIQKKVRNQYNKKNKAVLSDYKEYERLQKEEYHSSESTDNHWTKGQVRFIDKNFIDLDRTIKIIDIACGDGVGLRRFRELGFSNVVGVEFNLKKKEIAEQTGYKVFGLDMHDLFEISNQSFDLVYSSHTLEHAFDIEKAVKELDRILKPGGLLCVVLPYVDDNTDNEKAHVAKYKLGLNLYDDGKHLVSFFENLGFKLVRKQYDFYREPEVWLRFLKE